MFIVAVEINRQSFRRHDYQGEAVFDYQCLLRCDPVDSLSGVSQFSTRSLNDLVKLHRAGVFRTARCFKVFLVMFVTGKVHVNINSFTANEFVDDCRFDSWDDTLVPVCRAVHTGGIHRMMTE